ncbi:MAG: Hsp70 family protein [Bryobacteraceae bacterium]|nr:Hsp70 family protein [Bryobacteraceae bacterium]
MRIGVDFGTTRIVVAAVDRGNYPLVSFETADGAHTDWYPPLIAVSGNVRQFGWPAWSRQQDPECTIIRSLKRYLENAGPETQVEIAGHKAPMLELLTELAASLRLALAEHSSLELAAGEALETMLGVPANANGNQRFLTVEAFRRAGFEVLGLLNEPSAASVEFAHANKGKAGGRNLRSLLVYDLGGGTFDASLVQTDERTHSIIASEGIPTLGGDDFDTLLAEMALDAVGISPLERDRLPQAEWFRLHEECRQKKEALHPNTRRIVVDLALVRPDWTAVTVPVDDFYERCGPMVQETLHAVQDLLTAHDVDPDAIYITGGGSELPLVPRLLRDVYGRRVRRSSYTHSATAIGLAIQADEQAGYVLRETFTRFFGVWREADAGRTITFDPLFAKGTPLPGPGEKPLRVSRRYRPVHNIGHFRYLECSHRSDDGRPLGDITLWDEIMYPFDPVLKDRKDLTSTEVRHCERAPNQEIEESYSCDAGGAVTVAISNLSARYRREYRLGRWSVPTEPLVPGKGKPRARKAARKS